MDKAIQGQFVKEPLDQVYRDTIGALGGLAGRALLVIREYAHLSAAGQATLDELRPWFVASDFRGEWPGTRLLGSIAEVGEYMITRECVSILASAVNGLYDWHAPFPEDLALLRSDRSVLLYSIGHEKEGGVTLYPSERETLLVSCPEVATCLVWHDPSAPAQRI